MSTSSIAGTLKEATGMSIGAAVVMIVLGCLAVILPFQAGIGVSILVSWTIILAGFAYVAYAFAAPGAGAFLWRLLVGVAYVVGGGYLAFHPGLALTSLTLVVAAIFVFEGVVETAAFIQLRSVEGSGWLLFDAIATFVLAYLIGRPWPASSTWAIGVLVGVNLIFSGVTRLVYSMSARKTLKAIA